MRIQMRSEAVYRYTIRTALRCCATPKVTSGKSRVYIFVFFCKVLRVHQTKWPKSRVSRLLPKKKSIIFRSWLPPIQPISATSATTRPTFSLLHTSKVDPQHNLFHNYFHSTTLTMSEVLDAGRIYCLAVLSLCPRYILVLLQGSQ